jgi:MFS family permease
VALLAVFVWHALRDGDPLIDLRLFANRDFAAASGTMLLFAVAVFGSMLLLPLYFQAVRGESALSSGLLLAPQGLGAMVMMPIAGQLTDRIGVGRIVLPGLVLVLLSMLALAQLGADTSYWITGAELFVFGLGMGATMMPIMSGAMRSLRRAVIARGSTVLNIIQQVGASIGTAVMSVLLTNALTDRLPAGGSGGGLGDAQALPAQVRDQIAPLMADAFGETFYWGMGLLCLAGLAALLLPRKLPEPVVEARDEDDVEAPVLIGV